VWVRYRAHVNGESAPPWPPLDAPTGLRVGFHEFPQPAPAFQYRCCVEICHSTGDRVIGWTFTTSETRREIGLARTNSYVSSGSLRATRVSGQEALCRPVGQEWDRASGTTGEPPSSTGWVPRKRASARGRQASQGPCPRIWRRSRSGDGAGNRGASRCAGRSFSLAKRLREVSLKLALFSLRLDRLEGTAWEAVVRRVARFIRRNPSVAEEVVSRAALSYVSDRSPASFESYLRTIARVYSRSQHGEFEDGADAISRRQADWNRPRTGLDQEDPLRLALRSGRRVPSRSPVDPVPHPWAVGEAALLSRIADDFNIPPHIARQWLRDGKIYGRSCRLRVELTRTGTPARGKVKYQRMRARWQARYRLSCDAPAKRTVPARAGGGYDAARRRPFARQNKLGGSLASARKAVLGTHEWSGWDKPGWQSPLG
jgi:hypothetical protein